MYEIKKGTKNGLVSAVTKDGKVCVILYEATQDQLKALFDIGYNGIIFNAKRKPKKVEEPTDNGE